MSYPELLFSDDPKHAKWRQIFHNSGAEGAQFIESVYGALLPEEREKVNKEFKNCESIFDLNKLFYLHFLF